MLVTVLDEQRNWLVKGLEGSKKEINFSEIG